MACSPVFDVWLQGTLTGQESCDLCRQVAQPEAAHRSVAYNECGFSTGEDACGVCLESEC